MRGFTAEAPEDPAEVLSRVASIQIGARLTFAAAVAGIAYAVSTWDGPDRSAIVALFAAMAACALLPRLAGAERLARSRNREAAFVAWSALTIALTAALVWLDGGARSPLALLFFIPLVFAALSHPQRSVVAVGALDVVALVGASVVTDTPQPALAFFTTCLAVIALLCAWQADDHEQQREALARVSRADPLTGCLNRRGFEERLAGELDGCRRSGRGATLVMIDLDDFKLVNDTCGHAAGDDLLRWTVERAGRELRPMDALARPGGDEFAILLADAGPRTGREVAARLEQALGERVSISTGVASFPFDADSPEALHARADRDLYAAKHGRAPEPGPTHRELAWAAALAHAVALREAVPNAHASTVAGYAAAVAQRLGWSGGDLALLRMAAMLHDVGKVSVPDHILQKPGPLTLDEFEEIKSHPGVGAEIVEQVDGLTPLVEWIRHSHEHVDGSGYPDGLAGEQIPIASRILLVAEAFDAMTSARPYGEPVPASEAVDELWAGAGAQFDAGCVEALEQHLSESGAALATA